MYTPARRVASFTLIVSVLALARPVTGQQPENPLPPSNRAPRLVLAHPGPHAPVTALAFAPDASALYVAGFDKQVRRYRLVEGKYVADGAFRVPIGPWNAGLINALAVSPDGQWLAVAGRAPIRGEVWAGAEDATEADLRFASAEMRGDTGIVYLFDVNKPDGGKAIRGQLSEVRALAFANPAPASGPVLVTTGIEWTERGYYGALRVFDVNTGKQIADNTALPATTVPPGVAAWATGADKKGLRVGVAWPPEEDKPGKLLVWDNPRGPGAKPTPRADGKRNLTLAVRLDKDGAVAELITGAYHPDKESGGLTVRGPDGVAKENGFIPLAKAKDAYLPVGVAALTVNGTPATAVLSRVVSSGPLKHELRLITTRHPTVPLDGLNANLTPVFVASPDGRFIAVGGFNDNRVEVHDAVALVAGKPAAPQKLEGTTGGFSQAMFLANEKLWLGKPADSTEKGGVILDLNAKVRAGTPRANEKLQIDAPIGVKSAVIERPADAQKFFAEVAKAVGTEKVIALPAEFRVTAVAYLPAKPAWDANLGPIVAVAYRFERSQGVRLTLYDAVTAKPLYQLGGPTLPLKTLALSGTRPLLAGAGEDGTVAVWSLKNVSRPSPMIAGLIVTTRGNEVVVASVQNDSPARNLLKDGEVIESVKDGKGADRAVKEPLDFVQALRTLKVGDKAQIKVKGRAALVEVTVGTATGFRLPLFDLWVDPVAKEDKHAWVGWTSSGPYDASGADAESRIAWVTATGDPARPVAVAGLEQYRRLFYSRDFIRRLLETADYHLAYVPPTPPEFKVAFPGITDTRDGRAVTREKLNATVTLTDPDRAYDTARAELRWQVSGPGGTSEWFTAPFNGGQATLTLADREWKRGEYTVRAKLFRSPDAKDTAVPLEQAAVAVLYVPPAPELAVKIDGKEPTPLDPITAAKPNEVEVAVVAKAPLDPEGVKVTVSYTGGKVVVLPSKPDGTFEPLKLPLAADVVIQVTATNRGAGADAKEESRSVQARVRKPVMVPAPEIALEVLTASDTRLTANDPYVVSTAKATVLARVKAAAPLTAFDWKIGNGPWEAGKLDPRANTQTVEIDLSKLQVDDEKGVAVQVRAKTAAGAFATDSAVVRYDGLPEVSVNMPQTLVTSPELNMSGGLKVTSKRRFAVRVLVTSSRTGRTREFDPTPNAALTAWDAGITLFPGENQLGYVVRYDDNRKELRRAGLVEVRYLRPPVVLGGDLDIGTGASGTMAAVVASAAEAPPELLVNGVPVGASTSKKPLRVFGASLWMVTAAGVPANGGDDRLKPVSVFARNAERDGEVADVAVRGAPIKKEVPAPTFDLRYAGGAITPDRPLPPVGDANFAFDLKVKSDARLTRVEVWQGASPDGKLELLDGVSAAGSVAEGAGFSLTARPALRLRPGFGNYVRVLAANGGEPVSFGFYATYTPPPVRVEIDSIKEPNGQPVAVTPENAAKLRVASGVIEVQGRVLWDGDDEPVARDQQLSVVFVANGVAHLPVTVSSARSGERVRRFSGRVYLNAPDPKAPGEARVRAELRSGLRAVPQVGTERAAITVTTSAPVTRQRLHVLIIGVEVPEEKQGELVRKVIKSIGGKIPADNPNFTQGRFERDKFEFARLYPPQLGYTRAGHLNKLLDDVRADIERRATKPGDEWVNDVILLYYQGADWKDESGRWLLHTAPTMSGVAGKNAAEYAIRPDNLRPVPGMLVGVMNVTGAKLTEDPLSIDLPHLRYAWKEREARANLLGAIERAVTEQRTVEEMRKSVDESLAAPAQREDLARSRFLPPEVLIRVVGLKP